MSAVPDDAEIRFELDRLADYSVGTILAEVRRVAELVPDGPLTRSRFDAHAKVDSSTAIRRIGPWSEVLALAGISDRYSGRSVSSKMRSQPGKDMSDDQVLDEMRRLAVQVSDGTTLTSKMFLEASQVSDALVAGSDRVRSAAARGTVRSSARQAVDPRRLFREPTRRLDAPRSTAEVPRDQ